MIEIIIVLFIGFVLISTVKGSKKNHDKIKNLSAWDREKLKAKVAENPRRYFVVGGSFTNVPSWVFMIVILIFVVALLYGASSTT
ncbi:hypothetical protein [Microbulbifer celer]|uniref:Uncharacterized protein n=1 Tax=Microbulbifer celer TaxID=435905 RepID=A0ABW3U2S6_9GAMM|nr:hypothetical protein [Microbulbifer celer]UFN56040.1 hypothetical protein LPW13_10670 [Microbulbifer celer]